MKILLVAATPFEIAPLHKYLQQYFEEKDNTYTNKDLSISLLVTGIGMVATTFHLTYQLTQQDYDLVLNIGVAGAFNGDLVLGKVVNVTSEVFGDFGVEEADGRFTDMIQLGLLEANEPPFVNGKLYNPSSEQYDFLPKVSSLTVNKVHGYVPSIDKIKQTHPADIENMEGAAVFYTCLRLDVPFLEIRSISNFVEARNRDNWELGLAIDNLNDVIITILKLLIEA